MSKHKWCIMLMVVCIFTTSSGCTKTEKKQDEENVNNTESTINIQNAKEEKLDLDDDSLVYEEGTDAQSFLYAAEVTKAPNGYYYWDEMNQTGLGMLMYYDVESGQCVPLCNRPNCSHDDTECNAYFNRAGEAGDYFDRTFIQYYDGSVYILGYDTDSYVNLYKIAADGSSWEKCMSLYKADMTSTDESNCNSGIQTSQWVAPRVVIHRNYVYYLIWNESTPKIQRIKLGSSESENLYNTSGERASIDWMKIYGDYVFWRSVNYTDENYEDFTGAIMAYNCKTNKIYTVKTGDVGDFYISNDLLYYTTATGVGCYNLATQINTVIIDNGTPYTKIKVDSQYIYTYDWDMHTLMVYSLEGKTVAALEDEDVNNCWFGDEQYFFARGAGVKMKTNVEDLQKGKATWQKLK